MEQKISTTDELHMTRAIEKAASLAAVNDELDRNRLIVEQLQKEHVDSRFAKTAAAAFNKRLTVMKLQKTADEHKADPFPLCDPELVYQMMGGEPEITKTASVRRGRFQASYNEAVLEKAASTYRKPLYEETITGATFMERLGCLLEKTAAAANEMVADADNADRRVAELRKEVAGMLAHDKTAAFTLGRAYGQEFADAMQLDERFEKKACVLPSGGVYGKFSELVKAASDARLAHENLDAFSKIATELCLSAREFQDIAAHADLTKTAANLFSGDGDDYENYLKRRQTRKLVGLGLDAAVGIPAAAADIALTESMNLAKDLAAPVRTGFGNAYSMYRAGTPASESASSVLDADFILNDRYRDRMMAINDMVSDRGLSAYKPKEVLTAAQKAMNLDNSLERPDRRESMRPLVSKLLLQNLVFSEADTAAEATESSARAKAISEDPTRKFVADALEASKKERPADLDMKQVFTPNISSDSAIAAEYSKRLDADVKELSDAHKEYVKEKSTNAKSREQGVKGTAIKMLKAQYPDSIVTVAGNSIVLEDSKTGNKTVLNQADIKDLLREAGENYAMLGSNAGDMFAEGMKARRDAADKAQRDADAAAKAELDETQRAKAMVIQRLLSEHPEYNQAELSGNGELKLLASNGSEMVVPANALEGLSGKVRDDIGILGGPQAEKLYAALAGRRKAERDARQAAADKAQRDADKKLKDQQVRAQAELEAGIREYKRRGAVWDAGNPAKGEAGKWIWPLRDGKGNIKYDWKGRPEEDTTRVDSAKIPDDELRALGREVLKGQGR